MAYGNAISQNRLKDGTVGGFRVSKIANSMVAIEVQDTATNMIKKVNWVRASVTLVHDASQPMSQGGGYAVENVDPAHPLTMTLNTYLVPQLTGEDGKKRNPVPAEKCPNSDKMRWAFIKYSTMQAILKAAGYVSGAKLKAQGLKLQTLPLPGIVYMEVALSNGNNYPRAIGGPEILEEIAMKREETMDVFDTIAELDSEDDSTADDSVDAMDLEDTGAHDEEVAQEEAAIVADEAKKPKRSKKD